MATIGWREKEALKSYFHEEKEEQCYRWLGEGSSYSARGNARELDMKEGGCLLALQMIIRQDVIIQTHYTATPCLESCLARSGGA
jgi:hypothetical protein